MVIFKLRILADNENIINKHLDKKIF
jgi:hypothetical protein